MEAPLPAGGFTAALRAPRGRRSSKDFESSVLPELANGGQKSGRSRRASKDNLFSGVLGEAGADRPAQPIRRAKGRRRRASKWQLGDATFDTPEMKQKRAALRDDPAVAAVLDEWWDTTDVDGNGVIDRYEYTTLGIVLYRVIIGDGDEKAAKESAEKDWEEDRKGKEVMDGDHFKLAIFELADLWTDTLEPAEYVRFLKDLLEKMKAKGLGGDLLAAPAPGPAPDRFRRKSRDSIDDVSPLEGGPTTSVSARGPAPKAREDTAPASARSIMMTRYVNAHIEARHSPQKQEPPKSTPYDMVLNAQGSLDDVVERVERVRRVERAEKISPPQPAKAIVPQVPIESGGLVPSPSDGHRPCWLPHKATGDQKSKATATIVTHEDDPLEPGSLSSRAAGGRRGNPDLMGLREGVTLPAASWDLQDDFSVQAVRPARVYSIAAANGIPEPKGHQGLSQEDLEGLGADRPLAMAPVAAPASTSDLPPASMSPGMSSTVWGCPSLHMSDNWRQEQVVGTLSYSTQAQLSISDHQATQRQESRERPRERSRERPAEQTESKSTRSPSADAMCRAELAGRSASQQSDTMASSAAGHGRRSRRAVSLDALGPVPGAAVLPGAGAMGVAGATSANRGRRTSREIAPIGFAAAQMRFVAPPEAAKQHSTLNTSVTQGDSGQQISHVFYGDMPISIKEPSGIRRSRPASPTKTQSDRRQQKDLDLDFFTAPPEGDFFMPMPVPVAPLPTRWSAWGRSDRP